LNKNTPVKMPKRAMVLAAGFGKRLRPFTDKAPKALTKVLGVPMIDVVLDRLEAAGVERAVVNLHHLGEQIRAHLKDRKKPEIVFSQEDEILETGGGIVKAMPLLGDEPFFTVNAKIIWLNGKTDCLQRMAQAFDPDKMDGLLLLHSTAQAVGYDGNRRFPDGPGRPPGPQAGTADGAVPLCRHPAVPPAPVPRRAQGRLLAEPGMGPCDRGRAALWHPP
jgi:MurNAc alpha-1-phosphate uridylyltransferase